MNAGPTTSRPPLAPAWVGDDPASVKIRQTAARLAATSSTVLIRGESGTGKDLFAEIIHYLGPNRAEPLLKIDCATLPEALIESELFGHEKGAFTGAAAKLGRLELAGRGTVVLDEVAALTPAMQSKILRVVDQRTYEPLGGQAVRKLEARVVALSSANLELGMAEGAFREDLYFRLNVIPVPLPPLRARRGDIRPLSSHFLSQLVRLHHSPVREMAPDFLSAFDDYDFPGNARELRNIIEHALINATGERLERGQLPPSVARSVAGAKSPRPSLAEVEKEYIRETLTFTRGRKSKAATILGISRKTLLEKRRRYHLG